MKELSIEEKAKAYDEAIKVARQYYNDRAMPIGTNFKLEKMFPELKESKDERIRKIISDILLIDSDEIRKILDANKILIQDVYAWLEKQGEPIDKIVKRAMNEKQRVLLTETSGDANIDWDARSLQDVKLLLEYGLDYIKKLEKQGEQKPAEWSEEDEDIRDTIIRDLKRLGGDIVNVKPAYKEEVDWLKSLKPQNHWKPTEEQVEAFEHFVRSIGESGYASPYENNTKLLYSLLNDLKKLKE